MLERSTDLVARGVWTLRRQGLKGLGVKASRMTARLLDRGPDLLIETALIADSSSLRLPTPTSAAPSGRPLEIGWVCTPPAAGSGGHTTMFRMIEALEAAGHHCHLFLYDRFDGDVDAQRRTIRANWRTVQADVRPARDLAAPSVGQSLDAAFATSWESAHVLATLGTSAMHRLYFIQDYEPYFYPRGTEYALAEDSYRLGFDLVALGGMVSHCLRQQGLTSVEIDFGCDSETYHLEQDVVERAGVVCYARPENPRRGWLLAKLALAKFHERHPQVPITVYGSAVTDLPFAATVIPRLTPEELNALYNRSVAGLALSFTNVSLVPEELLSAGAIPVVNDAPEPRACLDNPYVVWAASTPTALAEALSDVIESPGAALRAELAAGSVVKSWKTSAEQLVTIVEQRCYGVAGAKERVAERATGSS